MNPDTPFHHQLLRLRWFVALGILAVLIAGQVIEHFLIRREGLTFTFFYESLFVALVAAGTWSALTWAARQIARRGVSAQRLAALYAIQRAAAASLNLDEVLRDAVEVTLETLRVDTAAINLLEPDGETLTLRAQRGLSDEFAQAVHHMKVGEGISGRTVVERKPIVLDVADFHTQRLAPFVAQEGFQTLASVPLLAEDRVLGALTLGTRRPHVFPPEELDFLAAVGRQLGGAVDRARLHTQTRQQAEQLAVLNRISAVIASNLELDEVYEAFFQEVARLAPLDRSSIVFFEEGYETFEVAAAHPLPGGVNLRPGTRLPVKGSGLEQLATERRALLRPDLLQEAPFNERDQLIAQGLRCALAVPLIVKGRLIGAVNFASRQPAGYSDEDIALLTGVAEQVAVAVENSRLYQATRERLSELGALFEASDALRAAAGVDELLPAIVDHAVRAIRADGGLLLLRARDPERTVVRAATGSAAWLLGREFSLASGPAERALQTSQPQVVPDLAADPTLPPEVRARKPPGASGIRLPLLAAGEGIGTIHLGFEAPHTFSPRELRLLTLLADMTATALQRASLREELEQRVQELTVLYRVGRHVTAMLDTEEVLHFTIHLMPATVRAEASYLFLWDAAEERLVMRAVSGFSPELVGRVKYRAGEGLSGWVFAEGQAANVADVADDPRWKAEPEYEAALASGVVKSLLAVPLKLRDKTLGVLGMVNKIGAAAFSPEDESLLTGLADYLAVALENARLYEQTRQRAEELAALAEVSTALRTAATLPELLPIILDKTLRVVDGEVGAITLLEGEQAVVHASHGADVAAPGSRFPLEALPEDCPCRTGQVRAVQRHHCELFGPPRGQICLPLSGPEGLVGAMAVAPQAGLAFAAGEQRLLASIADMVGIAVHRAGLHAQLERRVQYLAALRDIEMAIAASFDMRVTLNILLDRVTAHLGVHAADLLLLDPHTQRLEYAAGRGFRTPALQHTRLGLGEGLAGQAALERRVVSLPDFGSRIADFPQSAMRSLQSERFVAYYGTPLMAKGQVKGVLEIFHRAPLDPDPDWLDFLTMLAGEAAIAIDNAQLFEDLQRASDELSLSYDATLEGWARALELRDRETQGHTLRVVELTLRLARALRMGETELVNVRRGALLHDIGKMGVPDSILLKPGPLTVEEWEIMRRHPQLAHDMLAPILHLRPALDIPYYHHEKWDGTGYPRGLKGQEIPLAARIFAVADVWDALRSDRPYREAWPEEKARDYIREQAGQHFDPQVVEAFLGLV